MSVNSVRRYLGLQLIKLRTAQDIAGIGRGGPSANDVSDMPSHKYVLAADLDVRIAWVEVVTELLENCERSCPPPLFKADIPWCHSSGAL